MSEPILPLMIWPEGIAQARVPANDNALRLEALSRPCLGVANDESSPVNGDVWLVGDTPTGAFASFDENDIALYQNSSWYAWAPVDGLPLIVNDVRKIYVGGSTSEWVDDPSITGGGGSGTVTSVGSGTGLTGGPITTTGTLSLANTSVTPGAYTSADITVDAQGRITAAANGSGGGGSPAGSDTQVQYNNAGSFGAEAAFAYNASTNTLTVDNITTAGVILTSASTTTRAGIRVPHGSAPTSPVDGDVWTTSAGGMYVRINGVTVGPLAASGGGGVTGFTSALNTASPNGTVNVSSLAASGGTTNQHIALVPKGAGGLIGSIPDGSTNAGGNPRGAYSLDLQFFRSNVNQVASGDNSVLLGGADNRATGSGAACVSGAACLSSSSQSVTIGGTSCTASGSRAVTLGGLVATASGNYSVASGSYGNTRSITNSRAIGCASNRQAMEVPIYADTSNATPTVLTSDGGAGSATNQWAIPTGRAAILRIMVVARQTAGTGTGDCAAWDTTALLKNIGGTASIVGTPSVTQVYGDAGAAAWAIAITANNTAKTLAVTATGEASKTIQWTAYVIGPEA